MIEYSKRFWFLAVSLATLVGLFLAAQQVGRESVFAAIVAASALLAGAKPLARAMVNAGVRVRNYPRLLNQVVELQETANDREQRLRGLADRLASEHRDGVVEGQMQVVGALLAHRVEHMPQLVAVSRLEDETLLIAKCCVDDSPPLMARFALQVPGTGDIKGIVQVVYAEDGMVHLACVERTEPRFWEVLEERAAADPSPPAGVRLAASSSRLPLSFRQLAGVQATMVEVERDAG